MQPPILRLSSVSPPAGVTVWAHALSAETATHPHSHTHAYDTLGCDKTYLISAALIWRHSFIDSAVVAVWAVECARPAFQRAYSGGCRTVTSWALQPDRRRSADDVAAPLPPGSIYIYTYSRRGGSAWSAQETWSNTQRRYSQPNIHKSHNRYRLLQPL